MARIKMSSCGMRCTHQRAVVYSTLASSSEHPTAEEIYRLVLADHPDLNVSMATVYNTLEALCSFGLARKYPGLGRNGSARYDADCWCHPHLRDHDTGRIVDLPEELGRELLQSLPKEMIKKIEARTGFTIERICLELIGTYESKADANGQTQATSNGHTRVRQA
ncbi:MAG: transcriptional repressor [Phycisphaeraceae bacterium]